MSLRTNVVYSRNKYVLSIVKNRAASRMHCFAQTIEKLVCKMFVCVSIKNHKVYICGFQALIEGVLNKGIRWMPRLKVATKDVVRLR